MAYGLSSTPNMSGIGAGILAAGQAWGRAFAARGEQKADQQDEKFTSDLLAGVSNLREERAAQIESLENWDKSEDAKRVQKRIDAMDNAHLELVEKMENMEGGLTGWAANIPKSLKLQQGLKNLKEEYARRKGEASQQLLALKETPMNYQAALDQAMAVNPNVSQEAWGRGLLSVSNLQQHESSTRTMGARERAVENQATLGDQAVALGPVKQQIAGEQLEAAKRSNETAARTQQAVIDKARLDYDRGKLAYDKAIAEMLPFDKGILDDISRGELNAEKLAGLDPSQVQKAMGWYRVKIDLSNMKTQEKLAELKKAADARQAPSTDEVRTLRGLMTDTESAVNDLRKELGFAKQFTMANPDMARQAGYDVDEISKRLESAEKEHEEYKARLKSKFPAAFLPVGGTVKQNGVTYRMNENYVLEPVN